ncbi:hypothetical protein [Rubrivirga sp.]|uniref:hypothetical protein n=1 Tax=Rubrivirga sp. TaxID=1885344 RepID=UPI003C7505CA
MSESDQPIRIGAFPVPPYNTPGNASSSVEVEVDSHPLGGAFTLVARNDETEVYFQGLSSDASNAVLVTVLVIGGEPSDTFVSSRNHPVYLSEGRIAAPGARIDWLSLAFPDAPDRLVVNTRVFDLTFGRTVIVAPLADGTLRFLQVDTPPFTVGDDLGAFGDLLVPHLQTPAVREFLDAVVPRVAESR